MRLAIVNDLRSATELLSRIVRSGGHEVAWTAADGAEAVERCVVDTPDAILMDMIMPGVDGVEATRRIMERTPCPILVVTATVTGNASRVFDALGHGALDAVNTPSLRPDGSIEGGEAMLRRLDLLRLLNEPTPAARMPAPRDGTRGGLPPVLAIGASTGGPQAIATVLRSLDRPLRGACLVVQHLGAEFVPGLVEWLAGDSGHRVKLAGDGDGLEAGTVLVGPGGRHLVVDAAGAVRCVPEPAEAVHRPSVDILFESLARSPCRGVAVLLTGMGRDGAEGLLALRRAGWWTIAQDEASSIVWGMPGTAVRLGAAAEALPLEGIAAAVQRRLALAQEERR